MTPKSATPRKGAKNLTSVEPEILHALETGMLETANLVEGLAIRMDRLMLAVAPKVPIGEIDMSAGVVARMAQAGAALRRHLAVADVAALQGHPSDTVRGWVAFALGQDSSTSQMQRLAQMLPFAADPHFGVREWAWMAVRNIIVEDPLTSIATLMPWAHSTDVNLRRFASEATRPRGVWATAIPLLRKEPHHGLAILMPLRHDPNRYVENSVSNWMNDAAKDNPTWVAAQLQDWKNAGVSERLVKRAGRSLK